MTNTNKKNKNTRKLLGAVGMLTVSAAMLVSSTFAWFTMNKDVKATSMQVKAKAEGGLLINEVSTVDDVNWDDAATAATLPGAALIPTSTTNAAKWFHANSKTASDEAGATANLKSTNLSGDYEELTTLTSEDTNATSGTQAANSIFYKNNNGNAGYQANTTDNAYYVMYKYYLKVSNESGLNLGKSAGDQNVAIKSVDVTLPETQKSPNLDKALRVGIKMGGKMYIYAPVYGESDTIATYYATTAVSTSGTTQSITNAAVDAFKGTAKTNTALASLPGMKTAGTEVDVYIWFEGEDDFCQSDNITDTLDNITVDITFSLETLESDAATITNNEFAV